MRPLALRNPDIDSRISNHPALCSEMSERGGGSAVAVRELTERVMGMSSAVEGTGRDGSLEPPSGSAEGALPSPLSKALQI
jgi:hypothetical protein